MPKPKVAIDLAMEIAQCPGATVRIVIDGREHFIIAATMEETKALGGRQRVWTLTTEECSRA